MPDATATWNPAAQPSCALLSFTSSHSGLALWGSALGIPELSVTNGHTCEFIVCMHCSSQELALNSYLFWVHLKCQLSVLIYLLLERTNLPYILFLSLHCWYLVQWPASNYIPACSILITSFASRSVFEIKDVSVLWPDGFDTDRTSSQWCKNPEKSGHLLHCIWIECILTEKEIKQFSIKRMALYFSFVLSPSPMALGFYILLTPRSHVRLDRLLISAPGLPHAPVELLVFRTRESIDGITRSLLISQQRAAAAASYNQCTHHIHLTYEHQWLSQVLASFVPHGPQWR